MVRRRIHVFTNCVPAGHRHLVQVHKKAKKFSNYFCYGGKALLIREYRGGDEKGLEQCFIELQEFERKVEPLRKSGESIAASYVSSLCQRLTHKGGGRLFVAENEAQIVGFACAFARESLDHELNEMVQVAYLTDLVVLPEVRAHGIGKLLLEAVETFAKSEGAAAMTLHVLAANELARSFYSSNGYAEYELTLLKRL